MVVVGVVSISGSVGEGNCSSVVCGGPAEYCLEAEPKENSEMAPFGASVLFCFIDSIASICCRSFS